MSIVGRRTRSREVQSDLMRVGPEVDDLPGIRAELRSRPMT